jgi:hypothetical protein
MLAETTRSIRLTARTQCAIRRARGNADRRDAVAATNS